MRIALIILTGFLFAVGAADAGPWRDYFGVVDSATFKPVSGAALNLAIRVENIDPAGAAAQAGMRNDDRILASSGCRVYGLSETLFMRYTDIYAPMQLLVQRDGKILEISATGARPRTIGFSYTYSFEDHLQALTEIGLPLDQEVDPAGWRSWRQFPPRLTVALVIAAQADPQAATWLLPLYRQWRALCTQDFAAAAQEKWTPPDSLAAPAAFWTALAERNRTQEQDPYPAACGVDTLRFAYWYPWPLMRGPAVGNLVPEIAAAVEKTRIMPVFLRPDRETWTSEQAAHLPDQDPIFHTVAQSYVGFIVLAALDPKRHGGWPFRHENIWERKTRRPIITALEARLGDQGPTLPWIRSAYLMGSLVDALQVSHEKRHDSVEKMLIKNQENFSTLANESPWLAWRTAHFIMSAVHFDAFNVQFIRSVVRQFIDKAGITGTEPASRILAWCHAREPGVEFVLGDNPEGIIDASVSFLGFRALSQPRTRVDLVQAIVGLTPDSLYSERQKLFAAWLDMHRGTLQREDVDFLITCAGHGQAMDLLMDAVPDILEWQALTNEEPSFYYALVNSLFASSTDFDMTTLQDGIADIDWQSKPELAISALQRRYGHVIGCQILAEACENHNRPELATALHIRSDHSFQSFESYLQRAGLEDSAFAHLYWQRCVTAAISPATAELALVAGAECNRKRGKKAPWNCVTLSMAQASLLLKRPQECVEALVASCAGEESKGDEPFIGPYGLMRGEPKMRQWLIQQLKSLDALDAGARSRILAAAKPGYLSVETLVLLDATEKDLGKPSTSAGNDF